MKLISEKIVDDERVSSPSRGTWIEMATATPWTKRTNVVPLTGDVD